jgi:hypothetical protein
MHYKRKITWRVKLKRKITLTKEKKSKEWGQKKKQCTISLDWKMKLKTNKTFTKGLWKKIINQKNKDWIRKKNNTWKITIEGLNRKQIKLL